MCEATVMSPNPGDPEKRPLSGIVDPGDEKASPQEDPHHEKGEDQGPEPCCSPQIWG